MTTIDFEITKSDFDTQRLVGKWSIKTKSINTDTTVIKNHLIELHRQGKLLLPKYQNLRVLRISNGSIEFSFSADVTVQDIVIRFKHPN